MKYYMLTETAMRFDANAEDSQRRLNALQKSAENTDVVTVGIAVALPLCV